MLNSSGGSGATNDVAVAENSRFVVDWEDGSCSNFSCGIFARAYDISGNPVTGQVLVTPTSTGSYEFGKSAIDNSGKFVVVYCRYIYNPNAPNSSEKIYFQLFSAAGVAVGAPVFVDFGTYPDITMAPGGNFDIAYSTIAYGVSNLFVKRYNLSGSQIGARIIVENGPGAQLGVPFIRMLCSGNFVVAYEYGNTANNQIAYIKRFNSLGYQTGNRITVTTGNNNYPYNLSREPLLYFSTGWFSVISSIQTPGTPPTDHKFDYYITRYDANGILVTSDFLWHSTSGSNPAAAGNSCGDYSLLYHDQATGNIMVKNYSYANVPSAPYMVNLYLPNSNLSYYIGLSSNFFIAAWDRQSTATVINSMHSRMPLPSGTNNTIAGPSRSVCRLGCINCQKTAVIGSPAVPGYIYQWSPQAYLSNPYAAQPTVTHPGGSGQYSITYTLTIRPSASSCCQRTETVVVNFSQGCK